jgi:hypothetical protein
VTLTPIYGIYFDRIASHSLPALRKLAPRVRHTGKLTLADIRARQYYQCQLAFRNEVPHLGPISAMDASEEGFLDDAYDETPIHWPFPSVQLSDVEVPYDYPNTIFDLVPEKVFVRGKQFYWKPTFIFEESEAVVDKYHKIRQSGLSLSQLLTSRLYGVVLNSKGLLRGQLYHWLPIAHVLTWEVVEQATKNQRKKWAAQTQQTLSTLHRIDVIWGDVKAENMIINKNGNAIIIDLEGGATKGWVDVEKMDTKEGDLQGMRRLVDYILNDDSRLRAREKAWDLDHGSEFDEQMSEDKPSNENLNAS